MPTWVAETRRAFLRSSGGVATRDGQALSLARLLAGKAAREPRATAFRYKSRGLWHSVTWRDYEAGVIDRALGLRDARVVRGMVVPVVSDIGPDWVFAVTALIAIGARPLMLYQSIGIEGVRRVFEDHDPSCLVVDGLDWPAVLQEREVRLPQRIFLMSAESTSRWKDHEIVRMADVASTGRRLRESNPDGWAALQSEANADDPTILFVSAATSRAPKLVEHSLGTLTRTAQALIESPIAAGRLGPKDSLVLESPTGHVATFLNAILLPMLCGLVAHLPERVVAEAIAEVRPTFSFGFAHSWEFRASQIRVAVRESRGFRGSLFRSAERIRHRVRNTAGSGRQASVGARVIASIAFLFVFLPLISKFGLERLRTGLVIGPVEPELINLWRAWGVDLLQVYGTTEVGPLVARVTDRDVLRPVDGVALSLGPGGEITIRRAAAENEALPGGVAAATSSELTVDDLGTAVESGIRLLGRPADVVDTDGRGRIPLAAVEAALRFSPYIRAAAVNADALGALTAVLDLDFEFVARWANVVGLAFRTPAALRESDDVLGMVASEVHAANQRLASRGMPAVASFAIASRPFVVGRELSPSWSVRRPRVETPEKFQPVTDRRGVASRGKPSVEPQITEVRGENA
jgi:long-chain acyl-CoA synthetase